MNRTQKILEVKNFESFLKLAIIGITRELYIFNCMFIYLHYTFANCPTNEKHFHKRVNLFTILQSNLLDNIWV